METSTHRTRYSDAEQAAALAIVAAHAGSTRVASEETGIPETTLRHWRNQTRRPARNPVLVGAAKSALADDWEECAAEGVRVAMHKLPEASAAQAAVIAGIATEKMLLLRGEPTQITEHQDSELLAALRATYGQARAAAPIPLPDATTTQPQPLPAAPAEQEPPF